MPELAPPTEPIMRRCQRLDAIEQLEKQIALLRAQQRPRGRGTGSGGPAGAGQPACVAVVGFAFLLDGDAAFLIAGALGENHTVEELQAAQKAGLIWGAVMNVEASGRDVDHIVLTPSGVLAIESKWRFKGADERYLTWAVGKALQGARQARLVLQSKDIDYRTDVRPVLALWGGARRELPSVQVIEGVDVVRGDHLAEWFQQCSRGRLAQDHQGERPRSAAQELEVRRLVRRPGRHHRGGPPRCGQDVHRPSTYKGLSDHDRQLKAAGHDSVRGDRVPRSRSLPLAAAHHSKSS